MLHLNLSPVSGLKAQDAASVDPVSHLCPSYRPWQKKEAACIGCQHEAGTSEFILEIMSNADQISHCGGATTLIRDQNRLY